MRFNIILLIFFVGVLFLKFSYTQEFIYGVGIDFSSLEIVPSTITIKVSKNKLLEKIVDYFCDESFGSDFDDMEKLEYKKFFYEDIEKIFKLGFGNREIIRLVLIKQNVPLTTKSLVPIAHLCLKKGSIKNVAENFGLNYEQDIWLVSNIIYDKIVSKEEQ